MGIQEQKALLQKNYAVTTNKKLAAMLGTSIYKVVKMAKEMDLEKDQEALSKAYSARSTMILGRLRMARANGLKKL